MLNFPVSNHEYLHISDIHMAGPYVDFLHGYVCNSITMHHCNLAAHTFDLIGIGRNEIDLGLFSNNMKALLVDRNSSILNRYDVPVLGIELSHIDYGLKQHVPFYIEMQHTDNRISIGFSFVFLYLFGLLTFLQIVKCVTFMTKRKPYKTIEFKEQLLNSNCTICLEDYVLNEEVILIEHCDHIFHKKCLETWINTKNSCPNCQYEIPL